RSGGGSTDRSRGELWFRGGGSAARDRPRGGRPRGSAQRTPTWSVSQRDGRRLGTQLRRVAADKPRRGGPLALLAVLSSSENLKLLINRAATPRKLLASQYRYAPGRC